MCAYRFFRAKIGIVGVNGAGKSTLLKIMAGIDKDYQARHAAEGAKSAISSKSRSSMAKKMLGNVMEGVAEKQALLERYNELAMNYSDETAEEMASLQDQINAQNLWDLDAQVEQAMDALRCPPGDASVEHLSGGESAVALCKLLLENPTCCWMSRPTISMPKQSRGCSNLADFAGTVVLVTHDRYFSTRLPVDSGIDRGQGLPYEGNYSNWLEQKQKRMEQEAREDDSKAAMLARAGLDTPVTESPSG